MRRSSSWVFVLILTSCVPAQVRHVRGFRAALERSDLETARSYLSDDPRVWWNEQSGPGTPWSLAGGRWKDWDDHFCGHGEAREWHVTGGGVEVLVEEMNDYFRLTERGAGIYLRTYFIDGAGRITGTMVSSAPGIDKPKGRGEEFDRWLREHHPEEYEYLRPAGDIDPTGDRAARTRAMLIEWRREVELPAIEAENPADGALRGDASR